MKPAAEDLEHRRPVWGALAVVFLDTGIGDTGRARVVQTLLASGYSDAELDHIFWNELCPFLHGNLLSTAGDWHWGDDALRSLETAILTHPPGLLKRWGAWMGGGKIAKSDWQRIRTELADRREDALC